VLEQIKNGLGDEAIANMHIHVSGIAYGQKGERKHLDLEESDLNYTELLQALKDYKAGGLVICESPSLEADALLLQESYHRL
jgi:deoxyribonuclease-4